MMNEINKQNDIFISTVLNGEMDPLVPVGNKITPTDEDFQKAEKVAKVLQECVDYADGNPAVFVDELKRNIN